MDEKRTTWLVYNGASGSHDEAKLQSLVAALEQAGYPPAIVLDCHDSKIPDASTADRDGIDLLVVHGGDGTLSAALAGLEGARCRVLALPGGTFNLLARTIFGSRKAEEIVELLAGDRLEPRRRTAIRGGDSLAVAELLAGPGAAWAEVREELRQGNVGEIITKGWDAAAASTVGPMVQVAEPGAGRSDGYAGVRLTPGPHGIAIEGYGAEGLGDYVQQGIAILKRDFRDGPHDDLGRADSVLCRSLGDARIALMVDGECCEGPPEIRFSLAPLEVDLLHPRDD